MAHKGVISSADGGRLIELKADELLALRPGETLVVPSSLRRKLVDDSGPDHPGDRIELIDDDGNTYVVFQPPGSEIVVASLEGGEAGLMVAQADTPPGSSPGTPAESAPPSPPDSDFDWRIPAWIAGGVGAVLLLADSDGSDGNSPAPPAAAAPVISSNGGGATAALTVAENTTAVTTVVATDADSGTLTYSIAGGADAARFTINASTGALAFAAAPDFENPTDAGVNNSYEVIVQASDGTQTDQQTLTITVGDVTETPVNQAPVLADATRSLAENSANGTVVGAAITGTDPDGDVLSYSLTAGNGAFAIDGQTGAITVADGSKLDFETSPNFNLTVRASDGKGLFDDAAVVINLMDINEAPVITDTSFSLDENSTNGSAVGNLIATDPDKTAPNNLLTYSITGGNGSGAFAIDIQTGVISVADGGPLDFETISNFGLTVRATDGGGLFDEASVSIDLIDLNEVPGNNPPVYDDAVRSIAENSAAGTLVGAPVTATDPDGNTLLYAIVGGNGSGAFSINPLTGQISVADSSKLDFEQTPSFTLILRASDGSISNIATVQINITDVNEAPVINDQGFSIDENSASGTAVGSVIASDPDTTAPRNTLSYSITAGNGSGAFSIDSKTGAISVADPTKINFETTQSFNLTVKTTDGGGLSDDAVVTIGVNDKNETPTVTDKQGFTIDENSANGSAVGTALATDPDTTAPSNTLVYSLIGGNGAFAINSVTGAISVADGSQLDFETTPSFNLTVRATDGVGLFDDAVVTINLDDVNEAPGINDQSFIIDENSANGSAVATVVATDPDRTAPNNTLSYAITAGNASGAFAIEGKTGAISVADASKLDFETTPSFSLTVKTTDGGGLFDDAVVTITINDKNEAPIADDQTLSIDENLSNGTTVTTVVATDPDTTAPNNTLSYAITAGNGTGSGAFAIDSATGAITVADRSQLDYETTTSFTLTVTTTDGGGLTDDALITINLNDLFDEVSLGNLGNTGLVINGVDFGDNSGYSVASAGDVNGDGYDDLIIGAPDATAGGDKSAGKTYVVFGGVGLSSPIDLGALGAGGFTLEGIAAVDSSGNSVASAGDIDGDGYDDLIIGAELADPAGRSEAGESYVVYGSPSLAGTIDLGALGKTGFTIQGAHAGDISGVSVSSADDVNGDGFDDLLVGALQADPDGKRGAGETYLVFGGGTRLSGNLDLSTLSKAGFVLNGIDQGDYSGRSVASAGDVDGDGYDDLVIGAFGADDAKGGDRAGETYLVFGSAHIGAGGTIDLGALGSRGVTIKGIVGGNYSGHSVASAGDVNGDGYQDLIIGADFTNQGAKIRAGESYVVYGGPGLPGTIDLGALGNGGFTLKGIDDQDFSGHSVATAGDINGDGYDDLIIGAFNADPDGVENAGESYVIFGGTGLTGTIDPNALGTHGFTIEGVSKNDNSGYSVASAGDVDGDGFDDLLISAPNAAANGNNFAGQTYVVFGGDFLNQIDAALLGDNNANNLSGTTASETLIGGAGSDTLDGLAGNDVLIGGEGDDVLFYDAEDTLRVDGGNGRDILFFDQGGVTLNLGALNNFGDPDAAPQSPYTNIEIIDLGFGLGNTLLLNAADLFRITGAATGSDGLRDNNLLRVDGGPGDSIGSTTGVWLNLGIANGDGDLAAGGGYTLFQSGEARLLVDNEVDQSGIRLATTLIARPDIDGVNGFVVRGDDSGGYSGASVDGIGDFNGDGFDDVIIGARKANLDNMTFDIGESYVVFGKAVGFPPVIEASDLRSGDGSQGFILRGVDAGDRSGYSVAGAGDINGDGYDDLIIGAPLAETNSNYEQGETYVVYGKAETFPAEFDLSTLQAGDGSTGFVLRGVNTSDIIGGLLGVSSAGDINGDGLGDLIIGARDAEVDAGKSSQGESYVVYGRTTGFPAAFDLSTLASGDGSQGFVLYGIDDGDFSGRVSSAGDINGDGYDDLIISANEGGTPAAPEGEAYVIFGRPSGFPAEFSLSTLQSGNGSQGFVLRGIDPQDFAGYSIASAGDINGDGFDDLIVSAILAEVDAGKIGQGESYVVYGKASGFPAVFDLSTLASGDGSQGFVLRGAETKDYSGYSVSSAGDVNGDGFDDLIIGAPNADIGMDYNRGVSYLLYGKASGFPSVFELSTIESGDGSLGFAIVGRSSGDYAGRSVSAAGDVNGDGFDDLIVGAPEGNGATGTSDQGESYIIFGGDFLNQIDAARLGDNGDDMLSGTAGSESLNGGGGNDTLDGKAGDDVLIGGEGDDLLIFDAADTLRVDGGNGRDTLAITGSGVTLDLGALNSFDGPSAAPASPYTNIEIVDLGGSGENSLTLLDPIDLFHLTGSATGDDGARDNNLLRVDGDAGDLVTITAGAWTNLGAANGDGTLGAGAYTLYQSGEARLLVDDEVSVRQFQPAIELGALGSGDGFTLTGVAPYDRSGVSVASAGDVNGDGYDDVLVGAALASPNGLNLSGQSYLVFGSSSLSGTYSLGALGSGAVTFNGIEASDQSGRSLSSAGDVNGDGIADLIIGAGGATSGVSGQLFAGQSYVLFGGAGLTGTIGLGALGAGGFTIEGINQNDYAGFSVDSAGDVNGDGFDDLLVGAYGADPNGNGRAGETFVVFGGASLSGSVNLAALGTGGFTLAGITTNDQSGRSVASAGDVNGDGYDDLIIGAQFATINGVFGAGQSYVVYGGSGLTGTVDLGSLGAGGFTLDGVGPQASSGHSVASAGDINGDGFDDVIVGAFRATANGAMQAGESYVVFGGTGLTGSIELGALGSGGITLKGNNAYDQSGISVSSAGDVNGDGFDDLIVAAEGADPNNVSNAGESYLIFGRASLAGTIDLGDLGTDGITLHGKDNNDGNSLAVASAGDVNGDGFDDLIIGAFNASVITNSERSGESYVVYGGDFLNQIGAAQLGDNSANVINGTAAGESLNGGGGNDRLDGLAGNDVLIGGEGDDVLVYDAADTLRVDGGNGSDALELAGADDIDFTSLSNAIISNIERIDAENGAGGNVVTLGLLDLLDLSSSSNDLFIIGDTGDSVVIGGALTASGTFNDGSYTYVVYTATGTDAMLYVEQGVAVA